jgi:hypothetical protein
MYEIEQEIRIAWISLKVIGRDAQGAILLSGQGIRYRLDALKRLEKMAGWFTFPEF